MTVMQSDELVFDKIWIYVDPSMSINLYLWQRALMYKKTVGVGLYQS